MNEVKENPYLIHNGFQYFELLNSLIREAKSEIHLQTYIFETDSTGKEVLSNLLAAANRGVKVFLVVDGYGSSTLVSYLKRKNLPKHFFYKIFSPPLFTSFGYSGRRLHHKIVCIDTLKILIGGINIADKYKGTPNETAWLDFALFFYDTPPFKAKQICEAVFKKTFNVNYPVFKKKLKIDGNSEVKILQNDWFRGKNQIYNFYKNKIKNAKNEIIILGAYFLPGLRLRRAMKKAAKNGIVIKIILSGQSDVPLVKEATQFFYSFLIKNKIEIYEWTNSVLHGKLMLVDKEQLTVGSFNLNHLSQYGSLELNAVCDNRQTVDYSYGVLIKILKQCKKIDSQKKFTFFEKVYNRICYFLVKLGTILITLKPYFRKKVKVAI